MWNYPANTISWFDWYIHPKPPLVPIVTNGLLSDDETYGALNSCIELATYMLFCGYLKPACNLLEAVMRAQTHANLPINDRDKLMLETVWSAKPDLRFVNLQWQPFTVQDMAQGRLKLRTLASKPTPRRTPEIPLLGAYEDTDVPVLLRICQSYLSQPVDVDWPHANAREALDAMLKLHDLLPDYLPLGHSFYLEVEISLYLEDINKTRQVLTQMLKRTYSKTIAWHRSQDISLIGDCLCLEGFFEVSSSLPAKVLNFSAEHASVVSQTLISAINQRITRGQQVPLEGVDWKDLLDRLAIAVPGARPGRFEEPGTLLNPPASQEDIQKAESALGISLPQDFKDMVAVHNGQGSLEICSIWNRFR